MFFKIIQGLYLLLFFMITFFPQTPLKQDGKWLNAFRRRMAYRTASRKLFLMVLALTVLFHDLAFFKCYGTDLWQMPGFLFGLALLRNSWADTLLCWLHENRLAQMLAFALVMISLIEPGLYTFSAAVVILFAFSMMYPSRELVRLAEMSAEGDIPMDDDEIRRLY